MFNRYYQEELQYIRDLGEEFAKAHPTIAYMLAGPGTDPDVERLIEGVAFLAGRVRQKLDDEIPEITHALMNLMWPHYLRPVPSMAVLELQPVFQAMRASQRVRRGAEFQSAPMEGTRCRFRSSYDVLVNPISLEEVDLQTHLPGATKLRLRFRIWNNVKLEDLDLSELRLFLHGDPSITYALYLHLCRHVSEVRGVPLTPAGDASPEVHRPLSLHPVGFGENENLLPYAASSFPGYRLLQEYFSFPQKFLFIDIKGWGGLQRLEIEDGFEVVVTFDRKLPTSLRPTTDEVRLYCTPIVNLFPNDADPIRVDQTQTQYRLRPAGKNPLHYEIFSVDRVAGVVPGTAEEREIHHFYSFVHSIGSEPGPFYATSLVSSVVDDRLDTYLSFVDPKGGTIPPGTEVVSAELTCTNRKLAENLRVGEVRIATDSSPQAMRFQNLTRPTLSVAPPLDQDLHWRLISHLSVNHLSIANIEALRGLLELYNFQALRDPQAAMANKRRLEGIKSIKGKPADQVVHGAPLRGMEIELELLEDHYEGDGDLFLFMSVLNEFLGLYSTMNSFSQLSARGVLAGERYSWPPRLGRQVLI